MLERKYLNEALLQLRADSPKIENQAVLIVLRYASLTLSSTTPMTTYTQLTAHAEVSILSDKESSPR